MISGNKELYEAFANPRFLGDVHSLETPDQGLNECYYVELKPKYPNNKEVQFAVLWRLLELHQSRTEYENLRGDVVQEKLRENFQYIANNWQPRELESKDTGRAASLLRQCQDSVTGESSSTGWRTNRPSGYYQNNVHKGGTFPLDISERITAATSGLVIVDEWNDFMFVFEHRSAYALFCWSTDA